MEVFFTSDLHFQHQRGFLYEPRGFHSIEEHDEAIVDRWNNVVRPQDTVYILGDVMLNNNDKGIELLNRLNGEFWFIRGNHDTDERVRRIREECKNIYHPLENVDSFMPYAYLKKINGYKFYMSHYPTFTSNLENMAPLKHHTINLFGHIHQKARFYNDVPFMYNVSMDAHNCTPVHFDEVISDINAKVDECLEML